MTPSTVPTARDHPALERNALVILAACASLITADSLGLAWLRSPLLGVPAGLWVLALALLAFNLFPRLRRHASAAVPSPSPLFRPAAHGLARAMETTHRAARRTAIRLGLSSRRVRDAEHAIARLHAIIPWPARPGCVRLELPDHLARHLAGEPSRLPIDFVRAPGDRAELLDAVVRLGPLGQILITTPRLAQANALTETQADWAAPGPLTHAGLFPPCIRAHAATVVGLDLDRAGDRAALRLAIELFVALRRDPLQLQLADRLAGTLPFDTPDRSHQQRIDEILVALADASVTSEQGPDHPFAAIAARLVSARLTSDACTLDLSDRRLRLENAVAARHPDPVLLLRLAALRAADLDDDAAINAMIRADRLIRARQPGFASLENLAFLQSELEHSPDTALCLGRVAAGIALLASTTPPSRLDFLRTDVLDDLRHTPRLLGRDHDVAFMHRVFRAIEQSRENAAPEPATAPASPPEPAIAA